MYQRLAEGEEVRNWVVLQANVFRREFGRNQSGMPLRPRLQSLATVVFGVCLLAMLSPAASAFQLRPVQPPNRPQATLDSLADQLAAAIVDVKENPVIVFDFAGPDELTIALEKSLADDFSAAMARMNKVIVILDRTRIVEGLQKKNFSSADLQDPRNAEEVAKVLKAKSSVWGSITLGQHDFELLVEAFRVPDGKKIAGFKATLPLTDQMNDLAFMHNEKNLGSGFSRAGRDGITYPSCSYCPAAQYSQLAVHHYLEGTVLLSVTVNADGRADDVVVLRALPYGLTEKAVETVKSWRFKPAQTSDGTPVAVRQTVETTFHLY
ncbi:MAG: energy transducer TonB [Candidatus Acidiferrales bacterium]